MHPIISKILNHLAHEHRIASAVEDAIYDCNITCIDGQEAAYTQGIITARNFFRDEGSEPNELQLYRSVFMHIVAILRHENIDIHPFLTRHTNLFCTHPDFYPNCGSCPGHTDHDFND